MIGIVAHKIGFVMFAAGFAPPVMRAIFVRRETPGFRSAKSVTAVGTLRQGRRVFLSASRAIPILIAPSVGRQDAHVFFAEPFPVANRIRRVPIVTGCTPPGVRAICFG